MPNNSDKLSLFRNSAQSGSMGFVDIELPNTSRVNNSRFSLNTLTITSFLPVSAVQNENYTYTVPMMGTPFGNGTGNGTANCPVNPATKAQTAGGCGECPYGSAVMCGTGGLSGCGANTCPNKNI